jgi:transcriptional regulator with XRE-family HTH domain
MKIGAEIKKMRVKRGWTQEDLAKIARVTRQTIYLIENDRVSPTVSLLSQIAEAIGTPLSYLLGEENLTIVPVETAILKSKKLQEDDKVLLLKIYQRITSDQNSADISQED